MDQCVILVGGKGTRLGELTRNFPKPMIEVNGKPFLLYILDYIQRFGFKEIILLNPTVANIFKIILKILYIKIVILLFYN